MKMFEERTVSLTRLASKVVKKLLKVSANRLLNDALFVGVMWVNTGNVYSIFSSLSAMKVVSTTSYIIFSERCKWTPLKKSIGWEAIITCIALLINGILLGNLSTAFRITMMMKVAILVNWAWFKYME